MGLEARKKGSAPKKRVNYQLALEESLLRFQAAFELLQITQDPKARTYYFDTMDKELEILDEVANNVERKGIRKQESLLSKDATAYILDQNTENFERLRQDISTLHEANRVPRS